MIVWVSEKSVLLLLMLNMVLKERSGKGIPIWNNQTKDQRHNIAWEAGHKEKTSMMKSLVNLK